MAERRMFSKTIIDSDAFLDMPLSTQALYFHLSMRADDDGFVSNPKKIQKMIGGSEDDLKLLMVKRYILTFDSGVVVIKHWKIHNYIQKDRYKGTSYIEEKSTLTLDAKNAYVEAAYPSCIQTVSKSETQDRLGKDSIGKDSISPPIVPPMGEDAVGEKTSKPRSFIKPTVEQIREYCNERNNNVDPETFYDFYESKGWLIGKNPMKDWKAAVRTWEKGNGRGFGNAARKDEPFNVFAHIQEQERRGT